MWNKTEKDYTEFHSKRRIFAIIKDKLEIGSENYSQSHDDWFIEKKWIKSTDDVLYEKITRGMISPEGDIYFYVGEDLRLTMKAEKELFKHLKELVENLGISPKSRIYGGMMRNKDENLWSEENGINWKFKKDFGQVKNFI